MNKSKKSKRINEKSETDIMVDHLEDEIKTDMHKIAWLKKEISEAKLKIAQNRKILEKLRKIK